MKFLCLSALLMGLAAPVLSQDQCLETWKCHSTSTPPVLDADFSEWSDVDAYTTTLMNTVGATYDAGVVTYKCLYDSENIYFMMEIPGEYRFSTEDNKLCAAIGTMFKIGEKATYVNMGGCPEAMGGCENGVPDTCDDYRVDIGAHWELKDTEQNTLYGMASTAAAGTARQAVSNVTTPPGSGNDLVANNDDEYAVSSYCRFDDDDADAGNEWSGAWAHTNPVENEFGNYHFEVSRTLKTASLLTDAQLTPGETIQFGVAFWDPYEMEETGWTDIGHFVTGCGTRWIDLELVAAGTGAETTEDASKDTTTEDDSSGAYAGVLTSTAFFLAVMAGVN